MSDDDDDDDLEQEMTSEDKTEARAAGIKMLAAAAEKFFAQHPDYKSVMLGVAQYWADEAEDAVHCELVASMRSLPLWPHRCDQSAYDADDYLNVPGELCWNCGEIAYLGGWDSNGGAIGAFQAFCHEAGSQEETSANNYLPYAVARKVGERVEVEVIGRVERPWDDFPDDEVQRDDTWDDPRARELLDLVTAAPADDGPRRVLADYLMERENPRGEYIALSLDNAEPERCAALLAEHGARWLHPLNRVLTASSVRWSRGFVVAADAYAHAGELDQIRGATAWGTIERLHIHRDTDCLLDPAMRSLRELGPIEGSWIDALIARPWPIESLDIDLDTLNIPDINKLYSATTLPKLRSLTLSGLALDTAVAALPHAVWWKQLERLTVVDDNVTTWYGRRRELGVPWLAIVRAHTDPTYARGWEVAYGPNDACEITQRGWTPHASIDALAELVLRIPAPAGYKLVASPYYEPSPVDMQRLALARAVN